MMVGKDESQPIWLQRWKVLKSGGDTTYMVKDCHTFEIFKPERIANKTIEPMST